MPEFEIGDVPDTTILPKTEFINFNAVYEVEANASLRRADAEVSQIKMVEMFRQLDMKLDQEHAERITAEAKASALQRKQIRENRIWQSILVTIGLLSLAATVIFGIAGSLH